MKTKVTWIGRRRGKPLMILQGKDDRFVVHLNDSKKAAIKAAVGVEGDMSGRRLLDAVLHVDVDERGSIDFVRGELAEPCDDRCVFDSGYYRLDEVFASAC